MSIKSLLASLFAQKDLPMQQYVELQEFKDLEREVEVIEKISEYNLPEVTKLICGSAQLSNMAWAAKYQYVKPLYWQEEFDVAETLVKYFSSCPDFEKEILSFADIQILQRIKGFFDGRALDLQNYRKEKSNLQKKVRTAKKKEEAEQAKTEEDSTAAAADIKTTAEQVGENTSVAENNIQNEGKKPQPEKLYLSKEETRIQELTGIIDERDKELKHWKPFIAKIEEYMARLSDGSLDRKREQAYHAIDSVKMPYEEEFLREFINTGIVPDDIAQKFKDRMFCNRVLQCLEKGSLREYAMPILEKLYEEGAIDFEEGEFAYFVEHNPALLSDFLNEKYQQDPHCKEDEDMAVLFDIAIKQVFHASDDHGRRMFSQIWNNFEQKDEWEWLLNKILDLKPGNINQAFCYYLLGVTGRSAKAANEFLSDFNDPDVGLSMLDVYSELLILQNNPERELILGSLRGSIQNSRKMQRRMNVLDRKVNSQSQELFSATYNPVNKLEELATNLRQTEGTIRSGLVAGQLIDLISELREGMQTLGVAPAVDIDQWAKNQSIPYNQEVHKIMANRMPDNGQVKARTMGFEYENDDGVQKIFPAEVYDPAKEVRRTDQRGKQEGKPNGKSNGKQGNRPDGKQNDKSGRRKGKR